MADAVVRMTTIDTIPDLCDWTEHHTTSHLAWHNGQPCPYQIVATVLAGRPDPRTAAAEWRIELPYEKPPLSLNDRYHWAKHAALVSSVKARTRNAVRDAEVPHLDHVHVELHYRPASNRFRDVDNIVATLKPCIDALHQPDEASLWEPIIDGDDPRYVTWSPPILHRPERGEPGELWLILRSYV